MTDHDDLPAKRPDAVRVSKATCTMCGAPVAPRYRPFCSRRCADEDLHRWLGGAYRLPTNEVPDPDLLEAELRAAERDGRDE